jgi:hypothetical protein
MKVASPDPAQSYPREDARVGLVLLGVALLLGARQLYWHHFVDEDETTAIALLIARGAVLYRDVFTNHLPFPYHWVAVALWTSGPSIAAARASVLLFQGACFLCAMWTTGLFVTVGVAALLWSAIEHWYLGNLALYYTFKGAAVLVVVAITLAVTTQRVRPGARQTLTFGIFAAIALLCDPFAVYPIGIALAAIALTRGGRRAALVAALAIAGCGAGYVAYLLLTASGTDFLRDAVWFNTDVYARVTPGGPLRLREAARVALRALEVFDGRWRNVDPFARLDALQYPDRWLFTGAAFRVAILAATIVLATRGKALAAAFVYCCGAVLLVTRYGEFFYAIPFVMVALLAAAAVLVGSLGPATDGGGGAGTRRTLAWVATMARVATAALIGWAALRGVSDTARAGAELSYAVNFYGHEERARTFAALACGKADVALASYPFQPSMYFFSGLRPASRYLFMVPWTVDSGMTEVLQSLERTPAIVDVDLHGDVWGSPNRDYLRPLTEFLQVHYDQLDPELYRSPLLRDRCPFAYRWDHGCADAVGTAASNSRWCSSAATLYLYNGSDPTAVTLAMALASAGGAPATLRFESALLSAQLALAGDAVPFRRTLLVPPGNHAVHVTTDARPDPSALPDRPLVFQVVNFRVEKTVSAAGAGGADRERSRAPAPE